MNKLELAERLHLIARAADISVESCQAIEDAANLLDNEGYDSTADTLAHVKEVNRGLLIFCTLIMQRAMYHDDSKLGPIEKPHFDRETPNLKNLVYNSPEYKESLGRLREALQHHYKANDHHPEFYHSGVNGMNLMSVVEMFFDWVAASKRNKGGTLDLKSSYTRFGFDPQLQAIFTNTALTLNIPLKD